MKQVLFPVDTGHKLNVLCMFNLRPVSTGLCDGATGLNPFMTLVSFYTPRKHLQRAVFCTEL